MQTVNANRSQLSESLDRLTRATNGYLRARIGECHEPGWIAGTEVIERPGSYLPDLLDAMAVSLRARDRKVVASFFLKAWLRQVVLASVGSYLLDSRVPDVSLANLAFRVDGDGRVEEIAFREPWVTVLDCDAQDDDPLSTSVQSLDALRLALHDSLLEGHVSLLIESLRPFVPVADRFMWATTADTCVGMMLLFGKWLGDAGRFRDEAEWIAALQPLKGKTGVLDVEHEGRTSPVLVRGCCCFAYHLDQYEHCKTCPLLSPEQRLKNIRVEIAAG